ncbi:hypothetical protein HaLaN_14257 [Haematococcus lacustris]|uniref:Uncharacterized protein n=1 Tax=Haematococcus lacustris TaxID=44745 RepID=A0A699Z4V6_HAELA|nr:hypothetical protein HaLaN_14257 [Haematococcus lacustris]
MMVYSVAVDISYTLPPSPLRRAGGAHWSCAIGQSKGSCQPRARSTQAWGTSGPAKAQLTSSTAAGLQPYL